MGTQQKNNNYPPVILLGGGANALSIARSLGPQRVRVYALNRNMSHIHYCRYSHFIPLKESGDLQHTWLNWLTGKGRKMLRGAVLLPCEDHGLDLIARNRSILKEDYLLIEANDEILLAMLDKEKTYLLSKQIGIATPEIQSIQNLSDVLNAMDTLRFPCVLKPRHSHLFQKYFPDEKLFVIQDRDQLIRSFWKVRDYGLEMLITEIIPGQEDAYCSYYSYLDEKGEPLFHFTKRKLRQSPYGFGLGTYHITDWNPEVAETGLRFFQGVGLRGIGNVEFKRDARDGHLKLIECNARFTLVNELLRICGMDFSLFVYSRLTGCPLPPMNAYRTGVRILRPWDDYWAFQAARRRGELTWWSWLRSLMHWQHFLYFRWRDPGPTIVYTWKSLWDLALRGAARLKRSVFTKKLSLEGIK